MAARNLTRGVFLDAGSLGDDALDFDPLRQVLEPLELIDQTVARDIVSSAVDAPVIITNKNGLTADLLKQLPNLELIAVAATGVNNIDLKAAAELGVCVCNCRDYATASVAQHTLMLILNLVTDFPGRQRAAKSVWSDARHFCLPGRGTTELHRLTLGLVGYGTLGQAVARLARVVGMQVIVAERVGDKPRTGRMPLTEVLDKADVVSLHCPLDESTEGLIRKDTLALMKPTASLVNTARGGLVVDRDLIDALKSGVIAGAALDVLDQEPPPADHRLLANDIPGLILTPHVAWASRPARQDLINQLASVIEAWRQGEPINRIC
jgi:glycerate dehydrogenase